MTVGLKLCWRCPPSLRPHYKRASSKRMRRLARLYLDDAPRRRSYDGWVS